MKTRIHRVLTALASGAVVTTSSVLVMLVQYFGLAQAQLKAAGIARKIKVLKVLPAVAISFPFAMDYATDSLYTTA